MKILVDKRNLVLAIDSDIVFGTFEGEEKWKIGTNAYYIDNGFQVIDANVPEKVIPMKYFYINNEFVLNENWSNTPEEISILQKENATLKTDLSLLQEVVNEMLLGV